ncbi:MAG: ribonuclease P protein component [Clostridia bacterium]|nr:ribonuclease P protein component [Clostridia bacterium]
MGKLTALKLNKEFRSAYYHGRSLVHPSLITYVRKNRLGVTRIGITTGKKIGKAVKRNRCRRIIREAFRQLLPQVKRGYDYVFVARAATVGRTSTELLHVMQKQLTEIGHLR